MPEQLVVIETAEGGAALHVDRPTETYFVDLSPTITLEEQQDLDQLLDQLDLEMMDESECASEIQPDGTVRVWCAEVEYDTVTVSTLGGEPIREIRVAA